MNSNHIAFLIFLIFHALTFSEETFFFSSDAYITDNEFFLVGSPFGGVDNENGFVHFLAPINSGEAKQNQSNSDTTAPIIDFIQPLTVPNNAQGFSVIFRVTDDSTGVKQVLFCYRTGGDPLIKTEEIKPVMGIYSKTVQPLYFSLKGFAWYIEAADNAGNIARFEPDNSTFLNSVRIDNATKFSIESGRNITNNSWSLFSLPFYPQNPSAADLLTPVLGNHDSKQWKMVVWNGSRYTSLSDSTLQFTPGQSYYIYSRNKVIDFTINTLYTTPISSRYTILLRESGWSHISVPFAFPVKWKNFFENDSSRILWNLEGPLPDPLPNDFSGVADPESVLYPWGGYWVYNPNSFVCSLKVAPIASSYANKQVRDSTDNANYIFTSLKNGRKIIIGRRETSSTIMEPPSVYENRLYLPTPNGSAAIARFHAVNSGSPIIDSFISEDNSGNTPVLFSTTSYNIETNLLWNIKTGMELPLLLDHENTVPNGTWLFVTGVKKTVDSIMLELKRKAPTHSFISFPYPNPFNPSTKIRIGLPNGALHNIKWSLANISGQLIVTNEVTVASGWNEIVIDANKISRNLIPSGIYLLNLQIISPNTTLSKNFRLIFLK